MTNAGHAMSPAEIIVRAMLNSMAWPIAAGVREADELTRSVLAALEAAGYVIVPAEPTPEMREAAGQMAAGRNPGRTENHIKSVALDSLSIYRAMLAARPR